MEAARSSKTLLSYYSTTQFHNLEDHNAVKTSRISMFVKNEYVA